MLLFFPIVNASRNEKSCLQLFTLIKVAINFGHKYFCCVIYFSNIFFVKSFFQHFFLPKFSKILCLKIFQNFFCKYFFRNFAPNIIFQKFFSTFFPQNLLPSKFFFKNFFPKIFFQKFFPKIFFSKFYSQNVDSIFSLGALLSMPLRLQRLYVSVTKNMIYSKRSKLDFSLV